MANGAQYPAEFEDTSGGVRLDGFIQFTDDSDQPATSSGINQYVSVIGPAQLENLPFFGAGNYDGAATGSAGVAATSAPFVIATDSTVLDASDSVANYVATGLPQSGLTDLTVRIYVTDQTGTNIAVWTSAETGTPSGGDLTLTHTPSGNNWNIVAGVDLTHPGDTTLLHSTAGGVFTAWVTASVAPD
jgi:hypothetical protein